MDAFMNFILGLSLISLAWTSAMCMDGCPDDALLKLNLKKWQSAFTPAGGLQAQIAAIETLGLNPLLLRPDHDYPDVKVNSPVAADIFTVPLTAPHSQERIIQIRYSVDFGDRPIRLIRVLRPVGPDLWCGINDEPIVEDWQDTPKPVVIDFVELLKPGTKAIQIKSFFAHYEGVGRGQSTTVAFWAVIDGKIQKVFTEEIESESYKSPIPDITSTKGSIKLTGGFPKEIEFRQTVSLTCGFMDDDEKVVLDDMDASPPCRDWKEKRTTRYRFDGRTYIKSGAPAK